MLCVELKEKKEKYTKRLAHESKKIIIYQIVAILNTLQSMAYAEIYREEVPTGFFADIFLQI